jgi:hypothetical protein
MTSGSMCQDKRDWHNDDAVMVCVWAEQSGVRQERANRERTFPRLPTIAVWEVALQFYFLPRFPKARNHPTTLYYAQRPSNIAYTPRLDLF